MTRLGEPLELPLSREPEQADTPIEMVRRQHSAGAAFCLACQTSGLEDKEIHLSIKVDAGTFSRIKKGEATLQADKIAEFCRVVGNTIYPEWLAYQVGCTLTLIKSEAERQRDEAEHRAREAEAQVALLKSLLVGRAAA